MGGVIVCEKVCPRVVSTSSLLSCDKSQSSLVDKTPKKGIDDNWIPLGGSVFKQMRVQRKTLPAFAVFQVPTAQIIIYQSSVFWGGMSSNSYSPILEVAYSAPLQWKEIVNNILVSNLVAMLQGYPGIPKLFLSSISRHGLGSFKYEI